MKYVSVLALISLFLAYLSFFLIANQSPFDKDKLNSKLNELNIETNTQTVQYLDEVYQLGILMDYLNTKIFIATISIISLFIVFTVATLHAFVDKLFFKKFYQKPDLSAAFQRGIEVALLLSVILFLRLMAGINIVIVGALMLLTILIDYLIISYKRDRKEKMMKNLQN